jgi:hypothetical protein
LVGQDNYTKEQKEQREQKNMVLTIMIHQAFMETLFASCLESQKRPRMLLQDIIRYLPCESEYTGRVLDGSSDDIGHCPLTSYMMHDMAAADGLTRVRGVQLSEQIRITGLEAADSWKNEFRGKLFRIQQDLGRRIIFVPSWYEVRKFAEFYLENSDLTTPLRPRGVNRLNMSIDEIIAAGWTADNFLQQEVDTLERHFLHSGTGSVVRSGEAGGRAFVDQFNNEEQEARNGEGPTLEDPQHYNMVVNNGPYDDSEDDSNEILDEILQERHDDNHHITPDPLKDSLREIQSIIDEDVKDLIPEGTYLILMNKMKQAYDRS